MAFKDVESGIPPDAVEYMRTVFASECEAALAEVMRLNVITFRLVRCALRASRGDLCLLQKMVDLGNVDYRDLIVAAEYDRNWNQVVSFSGEYNRELLKFIPPKS